MQIKFAQNVVTINHYAYFIGPVTTIHGSNWSKFIFRFDSNTEEWDYIERLPFNITDGCVTTNLTHLFIVGGYFPPFPLQPMLHKSMTLKIKNGHFPIPLELD